VKATLKHYIGAYHNVIIIVITTLWSLTCAAVKLYCFKTVTFLK